LFDFGPAGVARLGGNAGGNKRAAAADESLDAFLGVWKPAGNGQRGGTGQGAGAAAAAGSGGGQSLDEIEQRLLQAAPQDLSDAVKRKKLKKKGGK
jgi:hypothetical protein